MKLRPSLSLRFGNYTSAYSNLGDGWLTTMQMMVGNYAPQDDLGQDTITSLFYWIYILIASTLLLNALLGIILGAYDQVSEAANAITEEDVVKVMINEVLFKEFRAGEHHVSLSTLDRCVKAALSRRVVDGAWWNGATAKADLKAKNELSAVCKLPPPEELEDQVVVLPADKPTSQTVEGPKPQILDVGMVASAVQRKLGCPTDVAFLLGHNLVRNYGQVMEDLPEGMLEVNAFTNKMRADGFDAETRLRASSCTVVGVNPMLVDVPVELIKS